MEGNAPVPYVPCMQTRGPTHPHACCPYYMACIPLLGARKYAETVHKAKRRYDTTGDDDALLCGITRLAGYLLGVFLNQEPFLLGAPRRPPTPLQ